MLKIKASDDCLQCWQGMQQTGKKAGSDLAVAHKGDKWQIYNIKGDLIECTGSSKGLKQKDDEKDDDEPLEVGDLHKDFCTQMKDGESCFGTLDYKGKLFFVMWNPDTAKTMAKMKHSSIMEAFKSSLTGISFVIQATEASDLAIENFEKMMPEI